MGSVPSVLFNLDDPQDCQRAVRRLRALSASDAAKNIEHLPADIARALLATALHDYHRIDLAVAGMPEDHQAAAPVAGRHAFQEDNFGPDPDEAGSSHRQHYPYTGRYLLAGSLTNSEFGTVDAASYRSDLNPKRKAADDYGDKSIYSGKKPRVNKEE
ncbi:hypothetical protein J4E85_010982 [Alternaria conjuncta]|uniref:uncharacterized protein n=1 Tax=Alternaria conjuncta TaxID=181017 RepID=UPI00221F8F4F|nr:uncharacterized protein J4E85_010982 [Alternaria conjuncta]KAI4913007.1 hypothetical protein J4E85_010982 [Alternaria conjuncta]